MSVFHRILAPVDFNASSRKALDLAVELAREHDAQLTVMHAVEVPIYPYLTQEFPMPDVVGMLERSASAELERTLAGVHHRLPNARSVLKHGPAWAEILATVEDTRADLVVMGTHGRRGVTHALLGSVAEKVIRMSPVAVLTVRGATG
jgi:nucleotide-binding universal stress UspA family protein